MQEEFFSENDRFRSTTRGNADKPLLPSNIGLTTQLSSFALIYLNICSLVVAGSRPRWRVHRLQFVEASIPGHESRIPEVRFRMNRLGTTAHFTGSS
jgi:hypothetical protein